ncbi:hypothetical protein HYALB_00010127 [Hymenoscyphus albidus]|uniref:BTB domain-containing protein n=1 Tax=Hymenoscyphus albidus TaxID=595503 RepID=A0A9N9LEH1_9HELO|nr:hypothetical protein HYALB_00010127 [Hymenoscyphus albidus]
MARRSEPRDDGATLVLFFPTLRFPSTRFGIRSPPTTNLAGLLTTTTTPSSETSFPPTGNYSNIFDSPQVVIAPEMANTAPARGENPTSTTPVTSTMLSSGRYSDLVFVCKGKSFKVHKAVVCLQSKPIAAAIDGGFKEAVECKFEFEEEDPKTVELFVKFLYLREYNDGSRKQEASESTRAGPLFTKAGHADIRGVKDFEILRNYEATMYLNNGREWWKNYNPVGSQSTTTNPNTASTNPPKYTHNNLALLQNAKLYIMAEKYDVQPLKFLAEQKYTVLAPSTWNSPSFITSLRLLYEGTSESDSLMNYAIRIASHHVSILIDRPDYALLCKDHGELGFEIMKALAQRRHACDTPPPPIPVCDECRQSFYKCVCGAAAFAKSYATMVREAGLDPRTAFNASRGRTGGGAGASGSCARHGRN